MARQSSTLPVESAFREQYRELDDETLREIAAGDVPWTREGHYVHAARLAARALLLERGAARVPHVPAWDPVGPLPGGIRAVIVLAVAGLAVGALAVFAAVTAGPPSLDEACDAARALVASTQLAQRYGLELLGCEVGEAERTGDTAVAPILLSTCITLESSALARLADRDHLAERLEVQRLADRPVPGRHCREGGVVLAELVVREHRPWFVRAARLQ